uniref:autotransporter domain-containing protein n=1 Tax=Anaerovibrio sp. TaxID=1872532 RepID=UPI0025EA1135
TYYSMHLGLGKKIAVAHDNTMDLYGKLFYTHQNSAGTELSTGEHYDFGSVNSIRMRLGGRYTHKINELNKLYAGLAYEYEFKGDATATYQEFTTPSPSIKGGSGMLELGWQAKASKNLTVGLSMNGWVGKKQGLGGNLSLNWSF